MRIPLSEARFGRAVQPSMLNTLREGVNGVTGLCYDPDLRCVAYAWKDQQWLADAIGADFRPAIQPPPAIPQPEPMKRPEPTRANRR